MKRLIAHIKDRIAGKVPPGTARSGQWPTARKHYLEAHPACAVCGSTKNVEVHHKKPFHLHPELELDPNNFITLCESKTLGGLNCHLIFGHLGSFKSFNKNVQADAEEWKSKIEKRPKDQNSD